MMLVLQHEDIIYKLQALVQFTKQQLVQRKYSEAAGHFPSERKKKLCRTWQGDRIARRQHKVASQPGMLTKSSS